MERGPLVHQVRAPQLGISKKIIGSINIVRSAYSVVEMSYALHTTYYGLGDLIVGTALFTTGNTP